MRKLYRITVTSKSFTFYGLVITDKVYYRRTVSEALEVARCEYAQDFADKNIKIENAYFDENDEKTINCFDLLKRRENGKSKKNTDRNC